MATPGECEVAQLSRAALLRCSKPLGHATVLRLRSPIHFEHWNAICSAVQDNRDDEKSE